MTTKRPETTKRIRRREAEDRTRRWLWLNEAQVAMGWFIVLGLAALLGTIYLSQASRIATTGRRMQVMQDDLETVKRLNADLERDIAGAQALDRLQTAAAQLGFVPAGPDQIRYVVVTDYPTVQEPTPTPVPVPVPVESMDEAIWMQLTSSLSDLVRGESGE
jgi:hypothetical protein